VGETFDPAQPCAGSGLVEHRSGTTGRSPIVTITPTASEQTVPTTHRPWHAIPPEQVARELGVEPPVGLSDAEVCARLQRWGPNRLNEPPVRAKWLQFLDQFRNLLVAMLVVGAVVAGAIGDVKDSLAIALVLLFNATLGYLQEQKAAKSLHALREMLALTARVRRDGRVVEVATDQLVPGDVVLLEAGDRIPIDGRVIESWAAEVDESSLTGESVPVAKGADGAVGEDAPLGDRTTGVLMNTQVTQGRLVVIATATGMTTEVGRIAQLISEADDSQTPLQRQLDGLGKRLAAISGGIVVLYFVLGLLRGETASETLISAVALLVAAIPEGLPAVVTLTLAVGTSRLARRGAIVKRLASVETLGSTSVICSDKTGTLTMNQMTVREVILPGGPIQVAGEGYQLDGAITGEHDIAELRTAAEIGVLCNDSHVRDGQLIGDPTEGALVVLAQKAGLDVEAVRAANSRLTEVPFDSDRKYMVTVHDRGGQNVVAVKGAWEVILDRCDAIGPSRRPLDAATRAGLAATAGELAASGLRVLAIASADVATVSDPHGALAPLEEGRLTLHALVGLLDPPRPEVAAAIAEATRAGIAVKMVTGDHIDTARAIAAQIGIHGDAIDGAHLDRLDDDQLAQRIEGLGVIARVSPQHKVRIVQALRSRGAVVAMTGDGVNDAAALTVADIGVAMGASGTEVAKEASDMVLADDNFATITDAVGHGRTIYNNILKFVRFQVATNIGALGALIGAQIANMPTPFNPIQLLWINLIMDGPPAMALGVDPGAPDEMSRPPRDARAQILSRSRLGAISLTGVVMAAGTLGTLAWAQANDGTEQALTLAFTTFVLFQIVNALNVRDELRSVFGRATLHNGKLFLALAAVLVLQVLAVHTSVGHRVFDTVALTGGEWVVAAAAAVTLLAVEELAKLVRRSRLHGG
jgi:Ca2+-transporting ATPase